MAEPTIQWLFDTPLIDGRLAIDGADNARLIATAIALAKRFTADIVEASEPRFIWTGGCEAVTTPRAITVPGAFWVLAVSRADDDSRLVIEDPRMAVSVCPPDQHFTAPVGGEPASPISFPAQTGGFVLYPAILRAELKTSESSCDWTIVSLVPKRR